MENFLEANLELLDKNMLGAKELRLELETVDWTKEIISENGQAEFFYEGNYYKLQSTEKEKEIERFTRDIKFEADNLFVICGCGNTDLIEYIIEESTKDSRVLVLEPNLSVFKYVLETRDLNKIFESKRCDYVVGNEEDSKKKLPVILGHNQENLAYNIVPLLLPNYYMYGGYFTFIMKRIIERISLSITVYGNSLEDQFVGFRNMYKNVDAFMENNSLKEIEDKFKEYPAIVIASGPSLDKNIEQVKELQDKAVIIACDASYRACIKYGIYPDIITSIERDIETYQYYYENQEFDEKVVLAGPGLLWPDIFKNYKGKTLISKKLQVGFEGWITGKFNNVNASRIGLGLSCAHVALSAAYQCGCSPIILIGQDLAYTNDKKHGKDVHTEFEGENKPDEGGTIIIKDIYGNDVKTDPIYNLFREWIENVILVRDTKVIDATEGGAFIHGTEVMPLAEAAEKYCNKTRKKKIYDYLEDIVVTKEERLEKYEELISDAKQQIVDLKKIQNRSGSYSEQLEKWISKDLTGYSEDKLVKLVTKMQKGDRLISYIARQKDIGNYYNSIIKHTVIQVKRIGNELSSESVLRNLGLQLNLMWMIKDSSQIIIKEYEKLLEYVENLKKTVEEDLVDAE